MSSRFSTKETGDTDTKENGATSTTNPTTTSTTSASGLSSTGLSDYTAQRLAELRARRAEREKEYKDLKSSASATTLSSAGSAVSLTKKETNGTQSTTAAASRTGLDGSTSSLSSNSSLRSSSKAETNGLGDSKDYSKEYTKEFVNKHLTSSVNLSRSSSRSTADQDDDEVIGFASLPEQVHRKALKRGFDFTLMVVGETGLGKSTLVQSLFLNPNLYDDRDVPAVQDRVSKTVDIEMKYMEIEERGVKLRLTIVDTPGFNDAVNGEAGWKPVEQYINKQFDQYLNDESGLSRKNIKDNRVHCCLYFVSPFGHGLRQIDINFMKHLHDKVNIVPVIAKADTLTAAEIRRLKQKVLEEIEANNIHIYEFPECDSDEDEEFLQQDKELKAAIPFAVIGSNAVVEVGGKKVRGRQYPWGIVEVDNPKHCDFTKLRQMLISTHMQDLKDVTRDVHYENFRAKHIAEQMTKAASRERNKLKRDSSPNFENIMAQDQLLKQKDEEIKKMQEMLLKMQAQLQGGGKAQMNGQINGGLKKL